MTKRITTLFGAALVAGLSVLPAQAEGWSGRQHLDHIIHQDDRAVLVFGASSDWENPDFCDSAQRIVLVPDPDTPKVYTEAYAALLGAQLAGREANMFLSGCIEVRGKTFPVIRRVAVF